MTFKLLLHTLHLAFVPHDARACRPWMVSVVVMSLCFGCESVVVMDSMVLMHRVLWERRRKNKSMEGFLGWCNIKSKDFWLIF